MWLTCIVEVLRPPGLGSQANTEFRRPPPVSRRCVSAGVRCARARAAATCVVAWSARRRHRSDPHLKE
eukprot:1066392-Rhodomonas_salina.2